MGLFSFVGSILGGKSSKKAATKAADAQVQAAQLGIDETRREFDQSRTDQLPWLNAGKSALGAQGDLLGLNGGTSQQASIDALLKSPLYQSLFQNGENTLLANASASGGLRGGNFQAASMNFGRDTLSQVIQSQLANLGGISSQGGATGAGLGQLGAQAAQSISGLYGQQGAANAGKYLAKGAINAQNWNNAGSYLDNVVQQFAGMGGF
jgi:hypothetical protein